jgi:crotonobetainyl-CoA:carnitine CoA-transferase CaiB-like acyl-CoA transferase
MRSAHGAESPRANALEGLVVADFTETFPGPLATLLLAQLGADVIKVERPDGDVTRSIPGTFPLLNGAKRSTVIDMKTDHGRREAFAVATAADVVIEGFRPGKVDALGIGFDAVAAVNPSVIYCSVSGYGQSGDRRGRSGHDLAYLAATGSLASHSPGVCLEPPPGLAGDVIGGLLAAIAILGAVAGRQRDPRAVHLDVALTDGAIALALTGLAEAISGVTAAITGCAHYRCYLTSDDRQIALAIAPYEDRFWSALCEALQLDDLRTLTTIERSERAHELVSRLETTFGSLTLAECLTKLEPFDVPWEPVLSPTDALARASERGTFCAELGLLDLLRTGRHRPAPALGEYTLDAVAAALAARSRRASSK